MHPTVITVREVDPADLADWIDLRALLWPDEPDVRAEVEHFFRDRLIAAIPHQVFIATSTDAPAPIAFAECSLHGPPNPHAHLEGWYVRPEWRRRGIGRRLIAAAATWACRNGCHHLTSDTTAPYVRLSVPAHLACGFHADTATTEMPGDPLRFTRPLAD